MVRLITLFAAAASLLGSVQACYEQCGGINWTGSTTCTGGCVCTYQNDWYSQCIPGSATTTTTSKTSSSSSKTSTTTITTKSSTTTTKSSTTSSASVTPPAGSPHYWFSFGDSYTQTGFDITSTKPSAANVFGNPAYPGYTACGSFTNWIDEMIVSYNESYTYSYNFAYGGATIDATLVTPYTSTVLSMTDQVNQFLNNVGSKPSYAPWTSSNSIFSFFIGINDIGNSYYQSGDRAAFSDTLLNAYFALVQKVYDVGGRNFLFINIPCVDRSPFMTSQGSSATAAEKIVLDGFNTKLAAKINSWKATASGTKTWLYDSNTKLGQILNSPSSYGFQDATSYGSATNLVWCNNYHVSPGVHHYFATDIKNILAGTGF
ncbi:hypothetical protein FRC04_003470 [Tulasnella sp. 424]|nr:hypothetical protein FRC04_003470 [Tulasnella sp. 424]KAG8965734.1 hypothetical protein FRC05_003051 [Tulasnella sp. 425]